MVDSWLYCLGFRVFCGDGVFFFCCVGVVDGLFVFVEDKVLIIEF